MYHKTDLKGWYLMNNSITRATVDQEFLKSVVQPLAFKEIEPDIKKIDFGWYGDSHHIRQAK